MWIARSLAAALAGFIVFASTQVAWAQDHFPARPITLIVPFAAGGPTDIVARIIADHMDDTLGQPLMIENVVGAGGTTAALRAKRAVPDGHTIIIGHLGTHAAAVALYPKLAYDPIADFEPIGLVSGTPVLILARKDLPAANLSEFVSRLKTDKLRMAHAGIGSVSYSFCLMLNQIVGAKPDLISFNGTGPAMDALVAGHVDFMCDQIVSAIRPLEAQSIKAYAIGTGERSAALPNVPTSKEGGLPDFQGSAWNALFAPKGTPKATVEQLNAALVKSLEDPRTREQLIALGAVPPGPAARSPQALGELVRSEITKWVRIIKPNASVTGSLAP